MTERRFRKVNDFLWELPATGSMRVPGRVFASEKMLPKLERERVAEQVANVATLPGIQVASLAMPDAHWGYGAPVGGVAALDVQEGVISPGMVGYDISCLAQGSRVLHALGYVRPIEEFAGAWQEERLSVLDLSACRADVAEVDAFYRKPSYGKMYRVITKTGRQLLATGDHPFYTEDGMRPLEEIGAGERVSVYPFEGVPYEPPAKDILVTEEDVRGYLVGQGRGTLGNAVPQVLKALKGRGLLPLRCDSIQLPYLMKLLGYLMGDGTLFFLNQGKGNGVAWFFGDAENLYDIRRDASPIGFAASRVYSRRRFHRIRTYYREYRFERVEESFRIGSTAFAVLMACLGCPVGNRAEQAYRIPNWIFKAPLWQKRLFLSAFFGAELASPKNLSRQNLYCPVLSLSKREDLVWSGGEFLQDISVLLEGFGVGTRTISETPDPYRRKDGRLSRRLRLILDSKPASLIALYSKVGFSYHRRKFHLGLVAAQYLKEKRIIVLERERIAREARSLHERFGLSAKRLMAVFGPTVPRRFLERSIYEGRKTSPRVWRSLLSFEDYCRVYTRGLGESGMLWDVVIVKEAVPYQGWVYDFTMNHPSHNFVAEGFVVSNCGVRLLRSDLTAQELRPHLPKLMDSLFHSVPSGVGSTGKLRLSKEEMQGVFRKGAQWAIEKGFGDPEDCLTIEDQGFLADADPSLPSPRAVERGRNQLGTLGSGNHFLEVQEVDEVYDLRVASVFGLFKGQLVILIHTGSRGCGYQICADFLNIMQQAIRRYQISLPDRQLACVPLKSAEGRDYLAAMCAGANFARANRQVITHFVRESLMRVLDRAPLDLGVRVVYDVCHNIAKIEEHEVDGKKRRVCVHRKGATRAFPAGHPEVPELYREVGQPVFVPGSMGTYSYVLVGTEGAMRQTFGTTCHGAGRMMSRSQASKQIHGQELRAQLQARGIEVRTDSYRGLAEEAPFAYKDVSEVVEVCHRAGISEKVARMRPLGVVKG
ncbi:MAG: RtcB family protein [Elusimicrobia bacterium]|nr:RtcB family protein [Elusimicrobiota bacterium]